MLAPVIHILPLTTIRRERILPVPGKVVVRKGQRVSPTDVVAESYLAPEHLLFDISRGLGLSSQQADRQIQVKAGVQVAEGDVLAGPVGLARRVVRAKRGGRVVMTGGGQVLLEVESSQYELRAGLPGSVMELLGDRGAVVETTGALVQGAWGNGKIDGGLMHVLARSPDDIITPNRLDVSQRGSVVLGGPCRTADVLHMAAELPLRGLILASLELSLLPHAAQLPFPVVVLDGLGYLPMNSAAFKLLSTSEQREVALNAEPWDPFTGTRPEVVIPLPSTGEVPLPIEAGVFSPGQQVRVVRSPHAGQVATLIRVRPGVTVLPSGIKAPAGEVRLESGESVLLPLANLEMIA